MEIEYSLLRARVLVEIGWLAEAEHQVVGVLGEAPDNLDAISLFAKIKHVKGELSQAIACWGVIHTRAQHYDNVLVHIHSLLQQADEPALEHVLALVNDRRARDARAACAALAGRVRGADMVRYKNLAVACACIAEATGDLITARRELEQLGQERGFEHDLDRLFALVRVYDQIGTAEVLDAATRVYRYLLQDFRRRGIEKLSLLRRLAQLEERAGNHETANELEAKFVAGMRRRMHRPSLHDLVRVAAREYIPLERLRAVARAGDVVPDLATPREQALAFAIRGEASMARARFADLGEKLDRQYLADLAAQEGDERRAVAIHITAVADDLDPNVAGWLLERHERPEVARFWTSVERRREAERVLARRLDVAPLRPDTWRHLATLHRLAGRHDDAAQCAARASALARVAAARAMPVGRVIAAGVYHFMGRAKGLLHEVWVHREPAEPGRGGTLAAEDIHGNLTAELRAGVRNTFVAVRDYARAKFPHLTYDFDDYTYSFKFPKEDEPSGGPSAGLPSALAFLSTFLQLPVPSNLASSGMLVTEAHDVISIGRIGEADYKVRAALNGNARSLILPIGNRADLENSRVVPDAITGELVKYVGDLDQAVKLVFGADAFTRLDHQCMNVVGVDHCVERH